MLEFEIEEFLVPLHGPILQFEWHVVSGDLEEAIVQATIPHVLNELFLDFWIALIKSFSISARWA